MIAYILYSKNDSGREVQYFAERLGTFQIDAKLVDGDSAEGTGLTQNYDLTGRPAVALVTADGTLVERWQGSLPAAEEVSYLAHK